MMNRNILGLWQKGPKEQEMKEFVPQSIYMYSILIQGTSGLFPFDFAPNFSNLIFQ